MIKNSFFLIISNNFVIFFRRFWIWKWYFSFATTSLFKSFRFFTFASQKRQHLTILNSKNFVDFCCCFIFFKNVMMKTQTTILISLIRNWQSRSRIFISISKKIIIFLKLISCELLRRSMVEKYSSKSIDDKRLISIKSNLIYWSECWLFDVLQLTNIEIYLYSTIYEMNSFDVELDSYLNRSHIVRWISRDETLRESFNRTLVLRSFVHFVIRSLRIWAWSLNRWVRLIEDLAEIIEQALLDLRKAMRWLDVTYSYSKRKRNMILFLEIIVSVIRQWTHWIWKNTFLLNSSFEWTVRLILRIFFDCESSDSVIWNEDVVACSHSRQKDFVKITTVIHNCECLFSCKKSCVHARNACFSHYSSWRWSFRSFQNSDRVLCVILSEIHRKRSSFMNEKCCKQ